MDTNGNTKELLIKDLSARLPYDVKLSYRCNQIHILKGINKSGLIIINDIVTNAITTTDVENIKPYLFPLSSMIEEQRKEYNSLRSIGVDECGDITYFDTFESVDWCNKNHFDYRGLIPMGLAIDATNLNIY